MRRRGLALLFLATVLAAPEDLRGAPRTGCDLRGPLSDYWPKVVRDWSRRVPGLNFGPTQTPAWVSLVYGDPDGASEGRRLERFIRHWSGIQEWNWVRSEIWKRPYSRVAEGRPEDRLGFRQNLILMGTPASNPLLARALARVDIQIHPDSIEISGRRYSGGDLVLLAILPSPYYSGKYLLCIVGLTEEALLGLDRLPFGETDYVLFRGRRMLESGVFGKPSCDSWKPARRPAIVPEHRGWGTYEVGTLRYHFDASRTRPGIVEEAAARESTLMEAVSTALRFPRTTGRIEIYLYASADDKFHETGDGSPAHLEEGASAIHRVLVPGSTPPAHEIALLLIRRNLGSRGSAGLRLALALAALPQFEGRPLEEYGARLVAEKGLPDLPKLAEAGPGSPGEDLREALSAASFLRFLMEEGRTGEVKQLYLNSGTGSLSSHFRELLGEPLERAERRWAGALSAAASRQEEPSLRAPDVIAGGAVSADALRLLGQGREYFRARRDAEARTKLELALAIAPRLAEAHLLLARIAFRAGDAEGALREARMTLPLAEGDSELLSWAHVTLGRAEALAGRPAAAALELRDPSVARGPGPPRLVADLWLENLGLSPNRKLVEEQLRTEARADLQNFDWDSAERKLKAVLATNPDSAEAHFALSEVYMRHHGYWVERATLSNELHPGTTALDPALYSHLADRGAREMEEGIILSAPGLSGAGAGRETGRNRGRSPLAGLDLFDPALGKQGDSPDVGHHHFFLGRAYFFASNWERAIQELHLSLGRDGTDSRIVAWDLIYLGFIDLFQGRREAARVRFQAALDLSLGGRIGAAARKGMALAEAPP